LFEPFRPGVAERLGVGPDDCLARNPGLVYGRMTGWGQTGPMAAEPGHDIDYLALAGALHPLGRPGTPPMPPLNLVADFAGGGLMLAFGIVCALLERQTSRVGQVIDASMVDGSALLMGMFHSLRALGMWVDERGRNELDGGSHYYQVYETADAGYLAVGAIEPQFYANLLEVLGLDATDFPQRDQSRWPELTQRFAEVFRTRTRDDWCIAFAGRESCVAPVLSLGEAPRHPHNLERETFMTLGGVVQPAPAPRFSRTPPGVRWPSPAAGEHTDLVLGDWLRYPPDLVAELRAAGVVA
jgi:alpha-methylacyl-CoA racemase